MCVCVCVKRMVRYKHIGDLDLVIQFSNQFELTALRNQLIDKLLFIHIVTGCPELSRPAHAWYKREGNEAVIGCENKDKEWRLTCVENTWEGEVGNCTKSGTSQYHDHLK